VPPNDQSGVTPIDQAQRDETHPTGDYAAFFRAHHAYLWCSLRRLGVGEADLEDNVHEVFLAIYRRRQDYDPRLPVRPWIFAFALRRASDHRRGAWQRHRSSAALDDDLRSQEPRPDETAAAREERAMVLEALDDLTLEHRAVFVLHEIDGSAIPAVAEALEIPLNTAYSRLRAARENFTTAWRRLLARRGER